MWSGHFLARMTKLEAFAMNCFNCNTCWTSIFLAFIKFFDPAREQADLQNFYMEREWRVYGNVDFHMSNVSRVTLPGEYVGRFEADFPAYEGHVAKSEDAIA